MSRSILTITVLSIMFSAGIFSKDNLSGRQFEVYKSVSEEENVSENKASKRSEPTEVKNVWKDMPSYDRFGNEITARARENMLQNALSLKNNESDFENITESKRIR